MRRYTTREDTQMANKDMKGCPTSLALEKCKLMRYHYIPIRMANVESVTIPNTGKQQRNRITRTVSVGMSNGTASQKNTASFLKKKKKRTCNFPQNPASCTPGRLSQRNEDTAPTRMEECPHIHTRMFPGALLVIPLKLETTQISFSGRAVTQTALHPYHGTLFLNEEDQTADVHNLEEFWKNHNECKTLIPTVTQYMVPFFQVYQPLLQTNQIIIIIKLMSETRR